MNVYDSSGVESLVAVVVAVAVAVAAVAVHYLLARAESWPAVAVAVNLFERLKRYFPVAGPNMMGLFEADASADRSWSDFAAEDE